MTDQYWLAFDDRLQMHRPAPQGLQIGQRVHRAVHTQLYSIILVPEQQFAPVFVVSVNYVDERPAVVGQAEQKSLFHLLKFARLDHVVVLRLVVGEREQLVLLTELRRQEGVDKGNIVMNLAHLEDFLASEAQIQVPVAFFLKIVAFFPFLAKLPRVPAAFDVAQAARCRACTD